jgi:hypothetical protein
MENIISFTKKINPIIDDDTQFVKRNCESNKSDLKNTLYASTLTLKLSGIANTVSDLEICNMVTVSKNALIKKRCYKCLH